MISHSQNYLPNGEVNYNTGKKLITGNSHGVYLLFRPSLIVLALLIGFLDSVVLKPKRV